MNLSKDSIRILCYGDSYTWGYVPATDHERYEPKKRWTGVLQDKLGGGYEVIEEGLNSRTINTEDPRPDREGRNGAEYLIPCLHSHIPLDLVVLMLGTNELKDRFERSAEEISKSLENLYIKQILKFADLIIISPPRIDLTKEYARERYAQSLSKHVELENEYERVANKNETGFIKSSDYVSVGADGVHLDEANNRLLGEIVYEEVLRRLG
ncbi:MAG: GDSL-type esterase/lipase family protein [Candidatus Dojkabacteria bacterium]